MAKACIHWRSCKQENVSISTAEAELVAVSEGIKESEWLWYLMRELGLEPKEPIVC